MKKKKIYEQISLQDSYKNFIRAINPKTGKVLFERENMVLHRGRLFTLEKIFNDFYNAGDEAISKFNVKYYRLFDDNTGDRSTIVGDVYIIINGGYHLLTDNDTYSYVMDGDRVGYDGDTTDIYIYNSGMSTYDLLDNTTTPTRHDGLTSVNPDGTFVYTVYTKDPLRTDVLNETSPEQHDIYTFITNNNFGNYEIAFFKVGTGGTTGNPLEPLVVSPTEVDLNQQIAFRNIDTTVDNSDYSDTYCLKQTNGNIDSYFGKYFDVKDPIWVVDTVRNKIAKKLEFTVGVEDLRDVISGTTVTHRNNVERRGQITPDGVKAILKINNVNHIVTSIMSSGDLIRFTNPTTGIAEVYKISTNDYPNTIPSPADFIIIEKNVTDFTFTDYTSAVTIEHSNDNGNTYNTVLDNTGANATVNVVRNLDVIGLTTGSTVYYKDVMGVDNIFEISSTTITENGFEVKSNTTSLKDVSNGNLLRFYNNTTGSFIGSANMNLFYQYAATFSELALCFAELDNNNHTVLGTDEVFSKITFSSKNLEDTEAVKFEYYIFA